jgi:beta-glucuronidase
MKKILIIILFTVINCLPQTDDLITNVDHRNTISLNGKWHIIIDPYEAGYYGYHNHPKKDGYFLNQKPKNKSDLVEYNFDKSETLNVPGDWNTQKKELFLYEGTIWYKKSFNYEKKKHTRVFLYFGAANYDAIAYLNGKKLGEHVGGFTPFDFEITSLVKNGSNFIIVKIDNKRVENGIPALNTDWWNYGGLTRRVMLIEEPETFIQDYFIQLKKGSLNEINGWIKINGPEKNQNIEVEIPDAKITKEFKTNSDGLAKVNFKANLKLWSPVNPVLYKVIISSETDTLKDLIGFRTIETKGINILLNDKPVFLRGVSIHEEAPYRSGRGLIKAEDDTLLTWAKELGCNYVRFAHYPHDEFALREADRMGIMVWSEIPVYWDIDWNNSGTLHNAENQLREMITRDKNRASIIIWSMSNETPISEVRNKFLITLIDSAKSLDPTRLISMATNQVTDEKDRITISDPMVKYLDVIGQNEYIGWYTGKPSDAPNYVWESKYNKPMIMSELGAGALYGYHGDKDTRWTEEFQANVYSNQIKMLKKISFLRGMSPWILMDFRSPRRPLPGIQDFWNRKGLISNLGKKKEAFFVLQNFYKQLKSRGVKNP